jgi:hypothetical protein
LRIGLKVYESQKGNTIEPTINSKEMSEDIRREPEEDSKAL